MVLICIALIIISVECLFLCLLIICMSSLEKCLFRPAHYLITIIIFFFEMHEFFVYFGNKAFLVASFANIFPKKLHRCWDNQIPHAKEQSWTHTSLVIQNQLKMDQRSKCKTIKLLEENIGRTLFDINCSNIFFWICLLRQRKQMQK